MDDTAKGTCKTFNPLENYPLGSGPPTFKFGDPRSK